MTLAEAQQVATIVAEADDGCPVCVEALLEALREAFPMFAWTQAEEMGPIVVRARQSTTDLAVPHVSQG